MASELQHGVWLTSVVCSGALWFGLIAPPVIGQDNSQKAEEIQRLVDRLGSQVFQEREAAGKSLQAIGESALVPLRKAARDNADAEVRGRAERLVEVILEQVSRASEVRRYRGPGIAVSQMAFSPDGQRVLAYSGEAYPGEKEEMVDRTLRLWELETGKELLRVSGHVGRVGDLAFAPDGRFALSTGFETNDTTVRLWDLKTGEEVKRFEGHTSAVYSARFSPDGRYIVTTSSDTTVRLWDAEKAKELRIFARAERRLAIFSPSGRHILAWSGGLGTRNSVRLWETESGKQVQTFGDDWWFPSLSFSPSGAHLAIADAFRPKDKPNEASVGRIQLWHVEGKLLRSFEGHQDMVVQLAFSPDGRRLLSADRRGDVRLWDCESGAELRRFKSHTPIVLALAFTADGTQALTGHTDNSVTVWALPKLDPSKP